MKKLNKILSVILCVAMIFAMSVPAFAADVGKKDIPIIFVKGQGGQCYNAAGQDVTVAKEYDIKQIGGELASAMLKAGLTNNYKDATEAFKDVIDIFFGNASLDQNGDPEPGSEVYYNPVIKSKTSGFTMTDYEFRYDWRADAIYNGELLAKYIDAVLAKTGASKVSLVAFSEGSCVAAAYLTYHGNENKVDNYVMVAPACNGLDYVGALAAGDVKFTAKNVDKFVTYYLDVFDQLDEQYSSVAQYVATLVNVLQQFSTLDMGINLLQRVYEGMEKELALSDINLVLFPGFWSFINDKYYDAAMKNVFAGKEAEFASIIAKIQKYHTEVYSNLDATLSALEANGMEINVVAKYGSAVAPITADCDVQADGTIELSNASFGAKSAKLGSTLKADAENKYLSPDRIVDASTCRWPDQTFFVSGLFHDNNKAGLTALVDAICHTDGQVTVDNIEGFAQFNVYDKATDSIAPMTSENAKTSPWSADFFSTIWNLIKNFFKMVISLFKK